MTSLRLSRLVASCAGFLLASHNLASAAGPQAAPVAPPPPAWTLPSLPPPPTTLPSGLPSFGGPWTVPTVPGAPTLPTLPTLPGWSSDPAQVLADLAKCPPIEVAPGVRIPVPCDPRTRPAGPHSARRHYPPFGVLPPRVDLTPISGRVKNQQQVGVCWAFALSSAAEATLRRQGVADELSPLHLVAALSEKRLDASGTKGTAIASERAWPYETSRACMLNDVLGRPDRDCEAAYHVASGSWRSSPVVVSELARADREGQYRVRRSYLSLEPDELATVLAEGRTVVLGVRIDSVAWGHAGARGGTLPEYAEGNRGGHDVLLSGYTWVGPVRYFRIQNSWGTEWAEGGRVWISEPSLRKHILDAAIVDVYSRDANVTL